MNDVDVGWCRCESIIRTFCKVIGNMGTPPRRGLHDAVAPCHPGGRNWRWGTADWVLLVLQNWVVPFCSWRFCFCTRSLSVLSWACWGPVGSPLCLATPATVSGAGHCAAWHRVTGKVWTNLSTLTGTVFHKSRRSYLLESYFQEISRDFWARRMEEIGRIYQSLVNRPALCSDELQLLHQVRKIFHTYFTPDKRV